MTQEEKELLLRDLCARLPYYTMVLMGDGAIEPLINVNVDTCICNGLGGLPKPYLRPMSSMTEEEFKELTIATELQYDQLELMDWGNEKTLEFYLSEIPQYCVIKVFDWLNRNHFDYRGLIEKGLAIAAPEEMYNFNED